MVEPFDLPTQNTINIYIELKNTLVYKKTNGHDTSVLFINDNVNVGIPRTAELSNKTSMGLIQDFLKG